MWIQYLERGGEAWRLPKYVCCLKAIQLSSSERRGEKEEIERPREWRKYGMNTGERHIVKLFSECWDPRGYSVTFRPSMHMLCRPVGWQEGAKKVFVVIPFKLSCGQRERGSFLITYWSSLMSTCVFLYFGLMVLLWGCVCSGTVFSFPFCVCLFSELVINVRWFLLRLSITNCGFLKS